MQTVTEIQQSFRRRLPSHAKAGVSRQTAVKQLGVAFVREAWPLVKRSRRSPRAHCHIHGMSCPRKQQSSRFGVEYGMLLHIAGMTCVDWSGLGNTEQWLGDSGVVFLFWLAECLLEDEVDMLLGECVTSFDDTMMGELAASCGYSLTTFGVCPSMFGWPGTRQRKYMVLLRNSSLTWTAADPVVCFHQLFKRPLVLDGSVFWSAPTAHVNKFHQEWAKLRHLPATQPTGICWPSKLLMTTETRQRVRHWEEIFGCAYHCFSRVLRYRVGNEIFFSDNSSAWIWGPIKP